MAVVLLGGIFVLRRRAILNRELEAIAVQKPVSRSRPASAPSEQSPVPAPSPFPGPGLGFHLGLLGGQSAFCTDTPFLVNGKDVGAKAAAYLGMYEDGASPRFGTDGEAEVSVNASRELTVKFHPKNNYKSGIHSDFNGQYFLYVGLIPPWDQPGGKSFAGCGYGGAASLPIGTKHLHFKGDFKWISSESNPPVGSGAGNMLFGGWLAYNFPDTAQNIVAINDFSSGPPANPPSLGEASYECGPPPPGDWWHNLSWADWWNDGLADKWHSFDIDVTAAHEKAVEESSRPRCGRRLDTAASIQVPGLFVGPEYGVSGGSSVFMLRNLRAEIY